MATFEDIKLIIQALADSIDAIGVLGIKTPGDPIEVVRGSVQTPGVAWGDNKQTQVMLQGLADWFDDQGVSEIQEIKDKLNELIGEYNQFRTDYNAGTVPTNADEVLPLS
jgi:dihydroorotate dehydrogenase